MPPGPPLRIPETGMARRRLVYEGKAKILYEGPEPDTLIQYFKDEATAFNAAEEGRDRGQGRAQQPAVASIS